MKRTPLAWCNLTHDRVRFGLFVIGIAFAVILMFVQLGFRNALLDSNTLLHDSLRGELILVSPSREAMAMREAFPRPRLAQVRAVRGVKSVHAVYYENAVSQLRHTDPNEAEREPTRGIRVFGVSPDEFLLNLPELDPNNPSNQLAILRQPEKALFDRASKSHPTVSGSTIYGPFRENIETELAGQRIVLAGSFELGTDFTTDGTLILSEENFLQYLRRPFTYGSPEAEVDIGLIRLDPGTDVETAKADIRRAVATGEDEPDVEVFTPEELKAREKQFWLANTPIGFAFGFGLFMGLAVGLVICYQILSGDVTDHLPEYATLKAIGYRNAYLTRVVLQEAAILAVFGYILGGLVSWGAYELLTATTGLPMRLTLERAVWMFLATVLMCCASGLIALVSLLRADPADVF